MPDGSNTANLALYTQNQQSLGIFTASSGGNTPSIWIETGNAGSGNSGTILFQTGTATGLRGHIQIKDGSEGTSGQIWTSTDNAGTGHWAAAPATGVTSVGLTDSTNTFNITNTPVTSAGTLTISTFKSQSQNAFLAGPSTGGSGAAAFRAIAVADVPTLNQNTTGTAANITASSNSTLTTLSSLSLPGSQVSGNISGNAANITASSNSTLTTLSSLSLPLSQTTGVLPIANGGTDNGSLAVTAGGVLYTDGTKFQNTGAGTTNQVLQSNGASAPTWGSGTALAYGSAYFGPSAQWTTTSSGVFADPTFSGTAGFSTSGRAAGGITITAAASNLPGITFTPSSASAVYFVAARFQLTSSASASAIAQLTDGTVIIDASGVATATIAGNTFGNPCALQGIYSPGTTSAVTIKIQLGSENAGTAYIAPGVTYGTAGTSLEWTVFQLPLNIISSVSSSLIGGMVTYGVYT